jgi:hypothetical protein
MIGSGHEFGLGGLGGKRPGLGKATGGGEDEEEWQNPPKHLLVFWRLWRRNPSPRTRPTTTTMKMKIFVALPT